MFKSKPLLYAFIGLIALAGLFIRLFHISDNQFLFYDEALYIGYNRQFLNLIANNPAHNFQELGIILSLILRTALSMPKALWFLLLSLRVFILGPQAWFFARWISAFSGLVTVVWLYFWARRYFNSHRIALLSSIFLLILPSHVFYSRSGMQEALSALLFIAAIDLYMRSHRVQWRLFVSGILLACVYFTNYRMIIAPVFIIFIEFFNAFVMQTKIDLKKLLIYLFFFCALVLFVGCLYGGVNLYICFAWMFHQAQDAGGKYNPVNFVSYPYYVFCLEGVFFACFFWGNIYFIKLKEYAKLLPFGIALLQMLLFSFAAEKGVRYLCVVLPFMAAAAAVFIDDCWQRYGKARPWVLTFGAFAVGWMIFSCATQVMARSDYEKAVDLITAHDPQAIVVSTQPLVEGLFLADPKRIVPCPKDLNSLWGLYQQGAKYLILDPQAYISWTADGRRFSPPLDDFLEIILQKAQPLAVLPHFNATLLKRFVLDHNEQILDSIRFLSRAPSQGYGKIRIYALSDIFKGQL